MVYLTSILPYLWFIWVCYWNQWEKKIFCERLNILYFQGRDVAEQTADQTEILQESGKVYILDVVIKK